MSEIDVYASKAWKTRMFKSRGSATLVLSETANSKHQTNTSLREHNVARDDG